MHGRTLVWLELNLFSLRREGRHSRKFSLYFLRSTMGEQPISHRVWHISWCLLPNTVDHSRFELESYNVYKYFLQAYFVFLSEQNICFYYYFENKQKKLYPVFYTQENVLTNFAVYASTSSKCSTLATGLVTVTIVGYDIISSAFICALPFSCLPNNL